MAFGSKPNPRPAPVKHPDSKSSNSKEEVRSTKPRANSTSSASSKDSFHDAHFPIEEESRMIQSSNALKVAANRQFAASDYSSAITTYERASADLPNYLDYELAVLQSNIAACNIKLEQWKDAIEACERALQSLERELPLPKPKKSSKSNANGKTNTSRKEDLSNESEDEATDITQDTVVELPSENDEEADAAALKALNISDQRKTDIHRIRTKTFLRRARAKSSLIPASWSDLGGALEDYSLLATPEYFSALPASDQRTVRKGLIELPSRVNEAKEKEIGEMMGKLKELGNGILKPFGLSTDMFKMVKDEQTGGYSMNFEQGTKK